MIPGFCGVSGGASLPPSALFAPQWSAQDKSVVRHDGAGFAAAGAAAHMHRDGDSLLMIAGHPRVTRAELAGRIASDGLATTLAGLLRDEGAKALQCLADNYALVWLRGGSRPRVMLAIDRMGVASMHWARQGEQVFFATSLPLLVTLPGLRAESEPQAIFDYVYFHMIPAPYSPYKGISRLLPGTCVEVEGDSVTLTTHARTRFSNERGRADFPSAKKQFRELLESGVRDAAQGDAEVGSFLSGGTDSSTVTGYLGAIQKRPARCFSIGFDQQGFDESEYAKVAAQRFAADFNQRYVTAEDIIELVPKLAGAYGEPFGNSSVIPTYFCAKFARENGIDVLLGGDGGDELFGGNERYAKQKVFALYDNLPASLREGVLVPLAGRLSGFDAVMPLRKIRRYVEQARVPMPARMQSYNLVNWFGAESIFTPDFLDGIDQQRADRLQTEVYDSALSETVLNRILALDWKVTLADNDLRKVTTMCELAGVQARFPLMDERLVDFSAALPIDWKIKGTRLRWFFKEALRDFLPEQIINKSKHGFGLPFGSWVISHPGLRELAFDLIGDFRKRNIVAPGFLEKLCDTWIKETPNYYGTLVWLFMVLEAWMAQSRPAPGVESPGRVELAQSET